MSRPIPTCQQCKHCPTGESSGTDWERFIGQCSQGLSVGGHYNGAKLILYHLGNPGKCPKFQHVTRYSKIVAGVI